MRGTAHGIETGEESDRDHVCRRSGSPATLPYPYPWGDDSKPLRWDCWKWVRVWLRETKHGRLLKGRDDLRWVNFTPCVPLCQGYQPCEWGPPNESWWGIILSSVCFAKNLRNEIVKLEQMLVTCFQRSIKQKLRVHIQSTAVLYLTCSVGALKCQIVSLSPKVLPKEDLGIIRTTLRASPRTRRFLHSISILLISFKFVTSAEL